VVADLERTPDGPSPLDLRRANLDSVAAGTAYEMQELGGPNQRFGRHAAVIGARAAEVVRLGEQDPGFAAVRNCERGFGSGGAAADDYEVVRGLGGFRTFQGSS
jgi:hypothetical protein